MSTSLSLPLESVPTEVIEYILTFCKARDVSSIAQTSRQFRSLIYDTDHYLWRKLFLFYPFDDPRKALSLQTRQAVDQIQVDWKGELQRRVHAEHIARSARDDTELYDALQVFLSVIETSLPFTPGDSEDVTYTSDNVAWLNNVFQKSHFLHSTTLDPKSDILRARIRSCLALSLENGLSKASRTYLSALRSESRCFVYDLRNYTPFTNYGPFLASQDDGVETNWKHVEHIVHVVVMNMRDHMHGSQWLQHFQHLCPKFGLEITAAYSAPGLEGCKPHDWAGVEGRWRRFICFMDYRELIAFNTSNLGDGTLDPAYFDNDVDEAVRLVEIRLHIDEEQEPIPLKPSDDPKYPPIRFKGIAQGIHSANADIRGWVRRYTNGTIRWHFITYYDGEQRWSAEAVQIGNICSAAGLAGVWTGAEHEHGDPAGPFLMWKVEDSAARSST